MFNEIKKKKIFKFYEINSQNFFFLNIKLIN